MMLAGGTVAADDDVPGRAGCNNTLAEAGAAVLDFLAAGRGGLDKGRAVEVSSRDKAFEASALTWNFFELSDVEEILLTSSGSMFVQ